MSGASSTVNVHTFGLALRLLHAAQPRVKTLGRCLSGDGTYPCIDVAEWLQEESGSSLGQMASPCKER